VVAHDRGFRHFFWGGSFNTGWSSGFFDAVILLPFAIAAALRLQRAFPRARFAIAELALALGFVTVVRIALPYISGNTFFGHPRPAIGAVVGVVLATALIVLARIDRGASER
jgi:hypothetical protein